MNIGKHFRNLFVHLRVVFHGAGAQRVEPAVHTIIPLRESGEVANHLHLAQLREPFQLFSQKMGRDETAWFCLFNIPSGERVSFSSFSSLLENERLILNQASIFCFLHSFAFKLLSSLFLSILTPFSSTCQRRVKKKRIRRSSLGLINGNSSTASATPTTMATRETATGEASKGVTTRETSTRKASKGVTARKTSGRMAAGEASGATHAAAASERTAAPMAVWARGTAAAGR